MELTERKKKILRAIVESYIKAAEPGGLQDDRLHAGYEFFFGDDPQ